MKYQVRDGIVKLKICGIIFLTPNRKESKNCKPIMPLNVFNGIIWQMLYKGQTLEEIYSIFEKMLMMSENSASYKEVVNEYLKELVDNGFVVEIED